MFRDDKMLSKNYDLFVRDEQCDIYAYMNKTV